MLPNEKAKLKVILKLKWFKIGCIDFSVICNTKETWETLEKLITRSNKKIKKILYNIVLKIRKIFKSFWNQVPSVWQQFYSCL